MVGIDNDVIKPIVDCLQCSLQAFAAVIYGLRKR
jgi:hypothetical protein